MLVFFVLIGQFWNICIKIVFKSLGAYILILNCFLKALPTLSVKIPILFCTFDHINRKRKTFIFVHSQNYFFHLFQIYKSHHLPSTEAVVMAIKSILLPQDDNLSTLQKKFPLIGDGNTINNVTCRVVAELQTRACMVLASYLNDLSFSKEFIQHCGSTIDVLKSLAKECNTGDRLAVIEDHCTRLRLLYRDCAKPPPPPSKVDNRMVG